MWDDFTASMLWTSAALILLPNLLVILAKRKSRKLLLDTLESILAVALVIVLLGIVLGLPVGEQVPLPVCVQRGWLVYCCCTTAHHLPAAKFFVLFKDWTVPHVMSA